jgi:hypothetical protein
VRPDFLDQPVIQLPLPFAGQKFDDRLPAAEELGAVPPAAVLRIGQRDALRIAAVPGILGEARLFGGGSDGEGRQRRSAHRLVYRLMF